MRVTTVTDAANLVKTLSGTDRGDEAEAMYHYYCKEFFERTVVDSSERRAFRIMCELPPDPEPLSFDEVDDAKHKQWLNQQPEVKWCRDKNGRLDRKGGPAVVLPDGTEMWYMNGEFHREGGPAITLSTGSKMWCLHGRLHRSDGPAVMWADGSEEWWLSGVETTKEKVMSL